MLVLLSGCTGAGDSTPVILITIDTLRADHLSAYGYFRDTSPAIDALAADGVLFQNSNTVMATTLPAHTSLFTSSYTPRHGVRSNLRFYRQPVVTDAGFRTAAQLFAAAGYRTAAFVGAAPLRAETGIAAGFQSYSEPEGRERRAAVTTALAQSWLAEQPDERFFLWVHYFDPHDPYAPPAAYAGLFRTDERLRRWIRDLGIAPEHRSASAYKHNLYDAEIRYTDTQIGRLLDTLRERGLYDRAMIVVTSDHGEGLLQHGEIHHGVIFNEELDVPLIMKFPKGKGPEGKRVAKLVSLIDVLPTLVEALELPLDSSQFDGINVLEAENRYLMAEREHTRHRYGSESNLTLRDAKWKYFYYSERPDELFDLETDYTEMRNVINEHPEVAERMKRDLFALIHRSEQRGAGLEVRRDLSPERREDLRALGYLD